MTESGTLLDDGSIREWYEYGYYASGRMLREISYQPDGSLDYQYDYEYMTITVYQ